jgi:short-subunit dehydrogenase
MGLVGVMQEFQSLQLPLHCLINNAGIMMSERTLTKVRCSSLPT